MGPLIGAHNKGKYTYSQHNKDVDQMYGYAI